MAKAIIALPGPSLDFNDIDDEIPVICVNLALYWAPRCDFWVAVDQPKDIHYRCEGAYQETTPILVTYGDGALWRDFTDPYEILCTAFEPQWLRESFGPSDSSLLLALCFAVQNGIDDIELRGCDQNGVGYRTLPTDAQVDILHNEEAWEKRWEVERARLISTVAECDRQGIKITWS